MRGRESSRLPFSVEIPKVETQEVMRQAFEDEELKGWSDLGP